MGCHASNFRYEKLDEKADESKTFFSRITLGFVSDIIQTGNERPLEESDLSSVDIEGTQYLTEKLEDEWRNEVKVKRERGSQPRLRHALRKAVNKELIAKISLLVIMSSFCRLIQPVVLSFILDEMATGSSFNVSVLCLYSALISVSCFVQSFVHHNGCYALYTLSVQIKASLIGLVYKKVGKSLFIGGNVVLVSGLPSSSNHYFFFTKRKDDLTLKATPVIPHILMQYLTVLHRH